MEDVPKLVVAGTYTLIVTYIMQIDFPSNLQPWADRCKIVGCPADHLSPLALTSIVLAFVLLPRASSGTIALPEIATVGAAWRGAHF